MRLVKPLPDQAFLKECLIYNYATGILIWKVRPQSHFLNEHRCKRWNGKNSGKAAGTVNKDGYVVLSIDSIRYYAHRVIIKLITGLDPEEVDHDNGKRSDNSWINLNQTNTVGNACNKRLPNNNTSGIVGVSWSSTMGKWVATITLNHKRTILGYYADKKEAAKARKLAEAMMAFNPNHGRKA